MIGIEGLRCPECGRIAKRESRLYKTRRRWRWAFVSFILLLGASSLALTPKVRKDGLESIMPMTALILIERYRDVPWAYHELFGRIIVDSGDGWETYGREKLYDWQWCMLAETALRTIENAEHGGDPYRKGDDVLAMVADVGIEPPARTGEVFASDIEAPEPWRRWVLGRLDEEDFANWLGDHWGPIHDALMRRILVTDNPHEAYRLTWTVLARAEMVPDAPDRAVEELLTAVTRMNNTDCAIEVFDLVERLELYAAPERWKPGEAVIDAMVAILSYEHDYLRHATTLHLVSNSVVDHENAVRALQNALDDPGANAERIRQTLTLIEELAPLAERLAANDYDPEFVAALLSVVIKSDRDLGAFVIRLLLDDGSNINSRAEMAELVRLMLADEDGRAAGVYCMSVLAAYAHTRVRAMVPELAREAPADPSDLLPILEQLQNDEDEEVQAAATQAIEAIERKTEGR